MSTILELEQKIINITSVIQQEYPELGKYITEMPENNSEEEEINIETLKSYYHSLEELVEKYAKTHRGENEQKDNKQPDFPGYPPYPPSEDIYQQFKEEKEVDPKEPSKKKTRNKDKAPGIEKDNKYHELGADLDVPGSELDDQQESVGSEDEENNYYSLGGDNHNDLEEDKG
jgi:hypothetical protein